MGLAFVSEPIEPLDQSFDTARMARGEPGLPRRFRWRDRDWDVAAILSSGRSHGDCRNGSGERYVRRHTYRVRTAEGTILTLAFQRSAGRGRLAAARWSILSMET